MKSKHVFLQFSVSISSFRLVDLWSLDFGLWSLAYLRMEVQDQRPKTKDQPYIPLVISGSAIGSSASPFFCTSSTSRQSDCSSRTSTLNDSGKPGSKSASPLTIAS